MDGTVNARPLAPSAADSSPSRGNGLTPAQRWISLAEFVVGGAIVIGHNVYHVIPNEVPILFVIGLISLRVRDGGWGVIGLRWPASWRRTVLFALAAAAVRILLGQFVVDPLTAHFWPAAIAPSNVNEITGHVMAALRWLLIVWTFAAFGEEIVYRGYLVTREDCLLGRRCGGVRALWLRTLLQRPIRDRGFRHGWTGSRSRLPAVWTQPVGVHSGAWVH
jgi:membrane protease YdiL (CAAX protease family)